MLALREYLASEDATHNPGLLIIDTPLLGLDDPQLDPELQEARETIPAALYDYLALEQDGGQMIIADNTKFMPDIEPLKDRCKLIVFTKREGEGRYGFLLDAQDEDLIDLEETDDN
jgi:conserved phage-associated protein